MGIVKGSRYDLAMLRRMVVGAATLVAVGLLTSAIVMSTLLPGLARRYYLLLPGEVYPVGPAIQLPEEHRRETGDLRYAIVYQASASLPGALAATARPGVRVVPYESIIPRGTTVEESNRASRRLMSESQTAAAVVGLRAAGFPVRVGGEGVRIVGLIPDRPAAAVLRVGDVVLEQDGRSVGTASELIQAVSRRTPGDDVTLRVRRDSTTLELRVRTAPTPGELSRPSIGAYVETVSF
jgi:PDZ domain-containing protein